MSARQSQKPDAPHQAGYPPKPGAHKSRADARLSRQQYGYRDPACGQIPWSSGASRVRAHCRATAYRHIVGS